jgi:AcrR family transcriptional regulator
MRTRLSRAEQVERNRTLVLEAALRVFLERGYAGSTLEAIAEEAGFSKGVVYSQFDGKADLFLALLERRIDDRAAQYERVTTGLAGAEVVEALLQAAREDLRAGPGWAWLLVEFRALASRDPELTRRYAHAHARTLERLEALIGRAHADAGLAPAADPRAMAVLVMAFGSGIALEVAADPRVLDLPDILPMLIRAMGLPTSDGH